MHEKLEEQIRKAVESIRTKINEKFEYNQAEVFKNVIRELTKIKKDESEELLGHKFYKDVARKIGEMTSLDDEEFYESIALIGLVLDMRHPILSALFEQENVGDKDSAESRSFIEDDDSVEAGSPIADEDSVGAGTSVEDEEHDLIVAESNAVYEMLLGLCE